MSSAAHTPDDARYTWEDFLALDEDDRRELIDGDLVEVDLPNEIHEFQVATLIRLLGNWAVEHGGRVLASGYKVRITKRRGVMPDLQYFKKGRPSTGFQGLESGAPDLAVEIISPSSRSYDQVTKLNWYLSIGTPEYWVVDPEAHSIQRFVLDQDSYRVIGSVAGDDAIFEPPTFPGLSIPLKELFTLPE